MLGFARGQGFGDAAGADDEGARGVVGHGEVSFAGLEFHVAFGGGELHAHGARGVEFERRAVVEAREEHELVVVDAGADAGAAAAEGHVAAPNGGDEALLDRLMAEHRFDAVVHFAGSIVVPDSVRDPLGYYLNNTVKSRMLMACAVKAGIPRFIFSSTAAVYGNVPAEPVFEDRPPAPVSPYGASKLMTEQMLKDSAIAYGLQYIALRYFNVAGCEFPDLADTAELNLIPIAIAQLKRGDNPIVFGDDYPTPDGSCIRDYVHVGDLARAHLMAVDYLDAHTREYATFNVGSGSGASVLEVLDALKSASRIDFVPEIKARRAGDPPRLVADTTRIEKVFGLKAEHDLEQIVSSAWDAANN